MKLRMTSGGVLLAIGLLHEVVGVLVGFGAISLSQAPPRNVIADIARDGLVGAVEIDPGRGQWFWFFVTGLTLLILGSLMRHVERSGGAIPRSISWQIGAIGLAGGFFLPASGFWLLLPVAWLILGRGSRTSSSQ